MKYHIVVEIDNTWVCVNCVIMITTAIEQLYSDITTWHAIVQLYDVCNQHLFSFVFFQFGLALSASRSWDRG